MSAPKTVPASDEVPITLSSPRLLLNWLCIVLCVYALLVGVNLIGTGFNAISGGAEGAAQIFAFASNPLLGVILGVLATAVVQSSSTVTSVIVGLVAGGVPVDAAIPLIMGANMGTTLTNTIVSLGNLSNQRAFQKSFEAATVHDFFNLFSILVFLPLEVIFHPLEITAMWATENLLGSETTMFSAESGEGPVAGLAAMLAQGLSSFGGGLENAITIATGLFFIVATVLLLGKLLQKVMTGRAMQLVMAAIGRGPVAGVGSGAVITVAMQSSSTTTSLVVPLAGAGLLTTRQVYPFTLGANIGTCVTALLAAITTTGEYQFFALQIALVHLFYNVFGVLVFLTVPVLRELPLLATYRLGAAVGNHRGWALAYIGLVFFALPGTAFIASSLMNEDLADGCAAYTVDCESFEEAVSLRVE
ncbi:MAG: sodium:phosphate symporter [Congregibacter sp.]